jgi:hypothetical protein
VPDGQLQLPGIETGFRAQPVTRAELEVSSPGPVGHHADDVGQIRFGVEPVQLAAGDEREEVGGRLGVVVAAAEQPVLSSGRNRSDRALGIVV